MAALNLSLNERYTYADYLSWLDNKRRELINGFIRRMSPAPSLKHQEISGYLFKHFINYVEKFPDCRVFAAPFDVRLPDNQGSNANDKIYNVVQPDITIVCDPSKLDEKGCLGAPDMVVEIISPSTAKKDVNEKFKLYEKSGVREYWIASYNDNTVFVFLLDENNKYQLTGRYASDMKVKVNIFDDLEIDLKDVFKG